MMWSTLKVGLPLLKGFNNGDELFVVDVVTAGVHLQEYTGNGIVGGVTFENNREGRVKVAEDGGGGEVEVGETKKGLHLFNVLGQKPVEDGLHLSGVHVNTIWDNDDVKVVLLESFEDIADVVMVLFHTGGGGVGHTKEHHKVLEEAIADAESGFLFMLWGYVNVVIAGVEVNFGVDFGTAEAVNKVTNKGSEY
ncbi:hypothetical protein C0993_000296 [Termitomyces sp. T159_Od127]|nr:hypothetical protein C0993_000296 [Termitomyces sp. T159_Od127]